MTKDITGKFFLFNVVSHIFKIIFVDPVKNYRIHFLYTLL